MYLTFTLIAEAELQLLRTWYADPELQRRLSYPTAEWFAYVNTPNNYAWLIYAGDLPVGSWQLADSRRLDGFVESDRSASCRCLFIGHRLEYRHPRLLVGDDVTG